MKATYIKIFLRVLACLLIVLYFYDISIKKIMYGQIHLDFNDGLVLLGCLTILIDFNYLKILISKIWENVIKLLSLIKFKR